MQYYQKNDMMFYKFDESSYTFVEVFNALSQKRIMQVSDQNIYNQTLDRVLNNNFDASSESVFNEKRTEVINALS